MPTVLLAPPELTSNQLLAGCAGRLTYRQLQAWCEEGLLAGGTPGTGRPRTWSPVDLLVAKACSRARELGVPVARLHELARRLYARPVHEPTWAVLTADGAVEFRPPGLPVEQIVGGAGVVIAVDGLA